MNLAITVSEDVFNVIITLYAIGGVVLFITSFFPGNSNGYRIFSAVAGLGIAAWSAYALLFDGWIFVSYYVAALPFILAFKAISGLVKRRDEAPAEPEAASPVQPQ